jgi:hypothetical protein
MTDSMNNNTHSNDDLEIDEHVSNGTLITILKIVMVTGLCLIALGIYFHMYNQTIEEMGVTGIVISACCVAMGMIMSLPTKMYLTFVLVNREQELKDAKRKRAKENAK